MESWETEIFEQGQYADEGLFENFFEAREDQRPPRGSHQRNPSAALTMQYPLYPHSHFDTGAIKDEEAQPEVFENHPEPLPSPARGPKGGSDGQSEPLQRPVQPKCNKKPPQKQAAKPAKPAKPSGRTGVKKEPQDLEDTGSEAAVPNAKPTTTLPSGRRRISKEQTKILEESFQRNTHLDKTERERVCRETGLMVKNVNIWFQNRRQKAKTQLKTKPSKPDIVGFFANRDKRGRKGASSAAAGAADAADATDKGTGKGGADAGTGKGDADAGTDAAGVAGGASDTLPGGPGKSTRCASPIDNSVAWAPIPAPKTPYRGTHNASKRNSMQFQGSPSHDLGMQKPLFQGSSHENAGYLGLGVSNFDLPISPQQYSPTPSTMGEFSPVQQFPQYIATPKQGWEFPSDSGFTFPSTPGRQSPTRIGAGHRSLMQSPQLMGRSGVLSPARPTLGGPLPRSKSAAEIAPVGLGPGMGPGPVGHPGQMQSGPIPEEGQYPGLKRRCSNYGRSQTLHGLSSGPIFPASVASTAENSTQVSPHSSPPALHPVRSATNIAKAANTPFDAIGAAQAQRMMASRARSHTQPSLRYDSGARLHLDDSGHQAVLIRVDRGEQQQTPPPPPARPPLRSRSTIKVPAALNAGVHIPPPQERTTVAPEQYMLDRNSNYYDESVWQGPTYDEPQDEPGYFNFPSF